MRIFRLIIINLVKIAPLILYFFYKALNTDNNGFDFLDIIIMTLLLFIGQGISNFLNKTLNRFDDIGE